LCESCVIIYIYIYGTEGSVTVDEVYSTADARKGKAGVDNVRVGEEERVVHGGGRGEWGIH
jgi:hypothetical protein